MEPFSASAANSILDHRQFLFKPAFSLSMGQLIHLATHPRALRRATRNAAPTRAEFLFDLASPYTYLVAEAVDRAFDTVVWTPALGGEPRVDPRTVETRADQLGLSLEWPEAWPAAVPAAMRVASFAVEQGRGGMFVLKASRLAFLGGFDLDDPSAIADAAEASGLDVEACLAAACDDRYDAPMRTAAADLARCAGEGGLPALRVEGAVFVGDAGISDALRARRGARRAARG